MNPPCPLSSASTLDSLETLALISARLAHSLTNQLAIISGNICMAGDARSDADQLSSGLKAAVQAANRAGLLLGQFVEFRRRIKLDLGQTTAAAVHSTLQEWTARRPAWTLDASAGREFPDSHYVPLAAPRITYILDAMVASSSAKAGVLRLSPMFKGRLPHPLYEEFNAAGSLQISIHSESRPIDWQTVRTDLSNFALAATLEILAQCGTRPETTVRNEMQNTCFFLPLIAA